MTHRVDDESPQRPTPLYRDPILWAIAAVAIAIALLLFLAPAPARAQTSPPYFGSFAYGDNLTTLQIKLVDAAGAYDLTSAAVRCSCFRRTSTTTHAFGRPGSIVATGTVSFDSLGVKSKAPTSSTPEVWYDCRLYLLVGGRVGYTDPFRISVRRVF